MFNKIKQLIAGDDGRTWGVVAEPSIFRAHESRLCGPFTKRQARRFAYRFVASEPYGAADVFVMRPGQTWPPRTNRDSA